MKYLIILFTLLVYSFSTYSSDKLSITNASIDSESELFLEIMTQPIRPLKQSLALVELFYNLKLHHVATNI